MRDTLRKLFFNKLTLLLISLVMIAVVTITVMMLSSSETRSENEQLKSQLAEISSLSAEVIQIKNMVDSKEKKIGLRKTSGVVSTLEEALKGLGISAKAIRPLEKKKIDGFTEDNAELEIDGTDLNIIVNLLYKIEYSHLPMKIKNASIRTTFEKPDKFILKLTVSLLDRG